MSSIDKASPHQKVFSGLCLNAHACCLLLQPVSTHACAAPAAGAPLHCIGACAVLADVSKTLDMPREAARKVCAFAGQSR